jgi:uncharacterized protein
VFEARMLLPWVDLLNEQVPGLRPFDVHTHIGANDPDGYTCTREQLTQALEQIGARGAVFAMQEPDGYPAANDMILAEAKQANETLVPFCRVDPEDDPLKEAERCLAAGARGIKLHPRAERFTLDHPALDPVFALASERRLPLIVHAGRGIPALGRHAVDACGRHPGMRLILAHAGISDLAWIWHEAADHPNLFFDTSWWSPADLQALFALVPPGQILFGSDAPYGTPIWSLLMTSRHALQTGLTHDQLRAVVGEQIERLLTGDEPLDAGPPPGIESLPRDPLLERVHGFLQSALGQMFAGGPAEEQLALAALACEVGDSSPHAELCRAILALLELQRTWEGPRAGGVRRFAPGIQFVIVANTLARTPDVPLPPDPVPAVRADVGEREHG